MHDDVILPGAESLTSQKFNSELAIDKHYTSNLPEEELSERIEELFDQKIVADMGSLNYNNVARTEEEFPEPLLEDFVSDTAPEKFRIDRQVSYYSILYSILIQSCSNNVSTGSKIVSRKTTT